MEEDNVQRSAKWTFLLNGNGVFPVANDFSLSIFNLIVKFTWVKNLRYISLTCTRVVLCEEHASKYLPSMFVSQIIVDRPDFRM